MQVYIEQVFVNNFIINIAILSLCLLFLGQKMAWGRIILSAILGSTITILLSVSNAYGIYKYILIGLDIIVMCLVSSDQKGFFKHLLEGLVFVGFSFILYGLILGVVYFCGGNIRDIYIYNLEMPTYLFFILIVIYTFLLFKVIQTFLKRNKLSQFYYNINLTVSNKHHKLRAYLDTGNQLVDCVTNKPVVIVDYKTIDKLVKINLSDLLMAKKIDNLKNSHYINYATISGKSHTMLIFEPEELIVDGKLVDGVVGVSLVGFDKSADFQALLSPMVL